jgi:hypothetical protein
MKDHSFELWFYWIPYFLILGATIVVIWRSPLAAARLGRTLTDRQQKDDAKRNLFLLLFALRGSPVHYDFVKGLNQIDVVFQDTSTVLDAWHIHFAGLNNEGLVNKEETWNLQRTNLLSAMAVSLGYTSLQQTDILAHYYPKGHQYQDAYELDYRETKMKLYKTAIETNQLLILQIKNNLGLLGDGSEDEPQ